jgi:dienelactone hydrolase
VGHLVQRWRPLLELGWAIASVCVPGSGDHDAAWIRAGQRQHRGDAIKALAETIRSLQEELGVSPAKTALYGRSAGGLLVIAVTTMNPGLAGALYVESPYVDVLRTISNPELPLTLLETKEFGIGTNPSNILATGAWSPMEHIPTKGLDMFVVARSDKADLEVYPYEVVKWITRARGAAGRGHDSISKSYKDKFLYVSDGKGHFTTDITSRAEDLALLENWISGYQNLRIKNIGDKYNMPNRRNVTRKDRKSRKDRKNRNNAPANATMMGGKRRRNRKNATRKNRK